MKRRGSGHETSFRSAKVENNSYSLSNLTLGYRPPAPEAIQPALDSSPNLAGGIIAGGRSRVDVE